MIEGNYKIRIRYADTDQMGYVYYGRYANFYEIARVELFRKLGFSYKDLEDKGVGMPVIEMNSKFLLILPSDLFKTKIIFLFNFLENWIIS